MKKQFSILILILGLIILSYSKVYAQYPIPSYQIGLSQVTTTFEENEGVDLLAPLSREERQIIIQVNDTIPSQVSWATVIVYSLDNQDILGPYMVIEGTLLRVTIDDREWGVRVINYLGGSILSVWIE